MEKEGFNYEEIPSGYYDLIHEEISTRSNWHRSKFQEVEKILANTGRQFNTILDYGCGPGTFLGRYLKNIEAKKFGVDLSQVQIAYARETFGPNISFFSTDSFNVAQDKFDLIIAIEFIEHISRDETELFLDNCYSNLNPGGMLIMTTPNYKGFWPILERVTDLLFSTEYHQQHVSHYNKFTLSQVVTDSNFKVQKMNTILGFKTLIPFNNFLIKVTFSLIDKYIIRNNKFLLCVVATKS
jgi:cyclopropane fatty-acyl-phospholipid synthase-like methyltransferase